MTQHLNKKKLPQCSSELSIVYNDVCTFLITLIEALLKSNSFASIYSISITLLKISIEEMQLQLTPSKPLYLFLESHRTHLEN